MPRDTSITKEDRLWRLSRTATIAGVAIVLLVSLVILKPAAPDKITLLTGPEGTGYHELGKRYAVYLRDLGLEAEVQVTDGGFDNVKRLAAGAARSSAGCKRLIRASFEHDLETQLALERESFAECTLTLDFEEGITAFTEKRTPRFGKA